MSETSPIEFKDIFAQLQLGPLNAEQTERSFNSILTGSWNPAQIAAFLAALRVRGETATVIAAAARAMRAHMTPVVHGLSAVLDTCGTGGDGLNTVNISTGAALMCAALGVPVAKHGNKAVSSKSGSADVLQALGVVTALPAEAAARILQETNIAFLLAPTHHPAMRHVGPVRAAMQVRTIFNFLGPLANPAGATHQLIGTFDDLLRPVLAETLAQLGTQRAWIVRGVDGLDEVTPFGATRVTELRDGKLSEFSITPQTFGLEPSTEGAIAGGDAKENASIIEAVLAGSPHPARNAFILNAAAALAVFRDTPLKEAAKEAAGVLDDGRATAKLAQWRTASNQFTNK